MNRLVLLAVLLALSVGACTSSKSHPSSGMPTDAPGLSRLIDSAVAGESSAHLALNVTLLGQQLTGGGDQKLRPELGAVAGLGVERICDLLR